MEKTGDMASGIRRRSILGGLSGIGAWAAAPAVSSGAECLIGPPLHAKGPLVWGDMDQIELDAAYDQDAYAPGAGQIRERYASSSAAARERLGAPQRLAYGPSAVQGLDVYRAPSTNAPIFVYVHGGQWLFGTAAVSAFPAELFIRAGVHFLALDFVGVREAGGDLTVMADQVLRAIAFVYRNAASFGGDASRLYVGGFSSGGHLAAVAMTTDWPTLFGLPAGIIKAGLCMSGLYDMKAVRLSKRGSYIRFTDAMEQAMSPQRYLARLRAPLIVSYGSNDTPEFQRQGREFAAAATAAGGAVTLVVGTDYGHFEMGESLGNPYGPNGRAALAMMAV